MSAPKAKGFADAFAGSSEGRLYAALVSAHHAERDARLAAEWAAMPLSTFAVSYAANGFERVAFVSAKDIGDAVVVFRHEFPSNPGIKVVIVGVRVAGGNGGAR